MFVLLFFGCSSFVFCDEGKGPPNPVTKEYLEDLFQKGFDHREQIKSGQMEILNELDNMDEERVVNKIRREIKIAFDEQRRRVDRHNEFDAQKTIYDEVGCIGCYKKDNRLLLQYSNQIAPGFEDRPAAARTMCVIYDDKQLKENVLTKYWTNEFGFVPQYIAVFYLARIPTPEYVEKARDLLFSNTVEAAKYGHGTVEDEDYKGVPCKKISFKSSNERLSLTRETSVWISEGQGYSIRKFFLKDEGGPFPSVELLEVDVVQDKASGIWFPSSWHFERERDGKLRTRQNGTIKNVVLNQPIPDDIFDMKKIDILPKGVHVLWQATEVPPPHEGKLIWDGNDIVSGETHGAHLIDIPPKGSRIRKLLLINGAILCFIFAAVSYRSYRRSVNLLKVAS